jgi:DNA-binding PadR family transcriptional regulator
MDLDKNMSLTPHHEDILQIISNTGERGIGWYDLERFLSLKGYSVLKAVPLWQLLTDLREEEFVQYKSPDSQDSRYIVTEKGSEWLNSHKVEKQEPEI